MCIRDRVQWCSNIGDSQKRPRVFDETLEDKAGIDGFGSEIGRASCRERVCLYV